MKGCRIPRPEAATGRNSLAGFARLFVVVAAALRLQPPAIGRVRDELSHDTPGPHLVPR
jgi:hypothetical protein